MNCSLSKVVGEVGEEDGAVRWEEAVEEVPVWVGAVDEVLAEAVVEGDSKRLLVQAIIVGPFETANLPMIVDIPASGDISMDELVLAMRTPDPSSMHTSASTISVV